MLYPGGQALQLSVDTSEAVPGSAWVMRSTRALCASRVLRTQSTDVNHH